MRFIHLIEKIMERTGEILEALYEIREQNEEILDRLTPRIVGIEIVSSDDSGDTNMKKVQAVWSDGFHGFDSTHAQPSDWPSGIALSDTATPSELTDNKDGTFSVTGGVDDTVTAKYGNFTATYQFTATPATLAGIEIVDA